jgi:hypothetical protein
VLVVEGEITVSKEWYRQDRRCGWFWMRDLCFRRHMRVVAAGSHSRTLGVTEDWQTTTRAMQGSGKV